jgi:hypothetical protein
VEVTKQKEEKREKPKPEEQQCKGLYNLLHTGKAGTPGRVNKGKVVLPN